MTTFVSVKAVAVRDNGNGTFDIELPCQPLSEEDREALERLFPNTFEHMENLLQRESLLGAIATRHEVQGGVRTRAAAKSKVKGEGDRSTWKPPEKVDY